MSTSFAPLEIRRRLGRDNWSTPEPFGPDGWWLTRLDGARQIIVSAADYDGTEWVHASIASESEMPTYDDLCLMHRAVFVGHAYQCFVPPKQHVNIHQHALHLWGRLDGEPVLPEFGVLGGGSI